MKICKLSEDVMRWRCTASTTSFKLQALQIHIESKIVVYDVPKHFIVLVFFQKKLTFLMFRICNPKIWSPAPVFFRDYRSNLLYWGATSSPLHETMRVLVVFLNREFFDALRLCGWVFNHYCLTLAYDHNPMSYHIYLCTYATWV